MAQKSRSLISHIHLLFYKLFYIFLHENKVSDFSYTPVAQFAHQNVWDLRVFLFLWCRRNCTGPTVTVVLIQRTSAGTVCVVCVCEREREKEGGKLLAK